MALRADDVDLGRDRDLVVRSQAGDDDAFEDLYRRYFRRLYRFCLRRMQDPHEAEEVAQETFVRAYRSLPEFGGERRFYPWLTVIATRLCVDARRRRARTTPAPVIDLGIVGDTADERVVAAADAALVSAALGRLTPRHRDVLRLREQEGWTYRHIADQMGVTEGTVEALLHRARRALRREFAAVAAEPDARRLAGVGALGWLGRRLGDVRQRLAGFEATWAPAVGNAVAAAAVMIGSAVTVAPPPTVSAVQAGAPPSAVAVAEQQAAPGPHVHPHGHEHDHHHHAPALAAGSGGAPPTGSGSAPPASGGDDAVAAGAVLVDGDDGRSRAEEQPTGGNAGGVIVGADPEAIVSNTAGTTTHYAGWVQRQVGGPR